MKSVCEREREGGRIQNSCLGVQGLVHSLHQPGKHALIQTLGESTDGVDHLLHIASLLHVLCTNSDPWLDQRLDQINRVDSKKVGHLFGI